MRSAEDTDFQGGGAMGARMRSHDWRATPLGAPAGWPPALRTIVAVVLAAKQPMYTAWGPGLTLLYNDGYRTLLGSKDRDALGSPFLDVWAEVRDELVPLVERTLAGEPVHMSDITLEVVRDGRAPEAHFAFSYTPVRGDGGAVDGLLCVCSETTEEVFAARRQTFRLELEDALRGLEAPDAIVATAVATLGRHLGANRVGYGEVQADDATVAIGAVHVDGVAPLAGPYRLDAFGRASIKRLRRGRTVVVADIRHEPDFDPATFEAIETMAFVSVPVLRAGQLKATLFATQATPRHWSAGEVALMQTVAARVSDMVERVRAEHEARANEARFRTLTQAIPNQVWTAAPDGVLDWANDRTFAYSGASDVGFEGRGWAAIVHPDDLPAAGARWAASVATGGVYEIEFRIRRVDGAYRWHLVRAVPQHDGAGAVIRWIGTNTDIDDQKRAELELEAAKHAAEEANFAKSTFIANMSHELRTPLSAIIGYSEMMAEEIEDGAAPASLARDIGKVESNARHLLGLINDVLDLSKVESGKMEAYAEAFDVRAMVTEVGATVDALMERKRNRLVVDLGAENGAGLGAMHSDVTRVRQILLNLIGNAAKFTEAGTVTLAVTREGDAVRFAVADTGIGMTPEQLSKLFQRFQQADASTTRQFGGTGLGLALTKAFVTLLGGDVAVASRLGEGSTFTVTLPARLAPAAGAAAGDAAAAAERADARLRDVVLVIDDDETQRDLTSRFLAREGFTARTAADGPTGLALARRLQPRAILLDVTMPMMDGWSVLTALKADPDLCAIPVVMVTFHSERALATSLGAADYVMKPIDWSRLHHVMAPFRDAEGDVLVVDDEAELRTLTRHALERSGWSVTEAANGAEALEQVTRALPRAILLDLSMPVMDGFAFLHELRTRAGCADVPVVVLTARDLTPEDRRRLRGADQVLNKGDTRMADLVQKLHSLGRQATAA